MTATERVWDFTDPKSKDWVLEVLRREMDETFALAADPARWEAPTACEKWEVRDVIGHLVDTTEGYFPPFAIAREGGTAPEPLGLRNMAQLVDEGAKAFRKVPQDELLGRLRDDAGRMMREFESLSEADWTGLMAPHKYMGPLPAMFYPVFQLVDYAVHNWDIREGLGAPHALPGDAADVLVPLIFILWQATADTSGVQRPYTIGVRTSGINGGDMRVDVSADGVQFAPGDIEGCPAVLEFDPATLVLTGYARMNGGTVRGDRQLATDFRSLIFAI
ncbi:MAG: maleylpyruvate isomerase family mycothiol-dependent enzyme [Acidimicrobiales bacterium]